MASFQVTAIIDGDTFEVHGWKWEGQTGNRIRPTGYDTPEMHEPDGPAARERLRALIFNKQVELGTAHTIDRGRLVCEVFFNGKNLASYFPEYRT